ncbi:MAG: glutathione S-transferase N-terminal domain-containing protein [Pseudomonadota bacterium]
MEVVLYGVKVSAFVAKVRIALDVKELDYEEREPAGGYGSPAYRAIVPAGSVPGLTVDGAALHESNAICEWLEDVAPEPALRPEDPMGRARMRALLGFHDARVEASIRAFFPLVKREASEAEIEGAAAGVEAALERLEALLPSAPLAPGGGPTYAHLAFPCTLQMGRMLGAALGRPVAVPGSIAAWCAPAEGLPAVERSLAIHHRAMLDWLAGFGRG